MIGNRYGHMIAPALCGAILLAAPGALAQQGGDAKRGAALANAWCASCHIVAGKAARRGADRAPPFTAIARDPAKGPGYLRTWMTRDHVQMPNFDLTRREMDDLIAYFGTLSR